MSKQAMELALKALEWADNFHEEGKPVQVKIVAAIAALKEAIKQQDEQIKSLRQQLAEFEEDNQRKKDHIAHFRRQLDESAEYKEKYLLLTVQTARAEERTEVLEGQLAESQAREIVLRGALEQQPRTTYTVWKDGIDIAVPHHWTAVRDSALAMPSDCTALNELKKRWQREALLEAAKFFDTRMLPYPEDHLRRMADELEKKA